MPVTSSHNHTARCRVDEEAASSSKAEVGRTTGRRRTSLVSSLTSASEGEDSADLSSLSQLVVDASTSSRQALLQEKLKSSTVAQLHLSDLKLHGREGALALLEDKLASIGNDAKQGPILVAGVSGVGKSVLVERGLERPAQRRGMAFVKGKFDLNNNALPYSAFAEALARLAKCVAGHSDATTIKADVHEALGEEDSEVILEAMPGCEDFFNLERAERRVQSDRFNQIVGKEAVSRMQFAIRRLVKAVCSNMDGVVLFIDDLQWSDSASLDLLQSLVQDEDIPSLLLVGAYRDDEVSESHPLALRIKEVERHGTTITKVELGNLQQVAVQNLVAEALDMEDRAEKVEALAGVVHKKTTGNPFFVIFFLRSLYDDGLLEYNFAIASWRWDDRKITEKLVTENVTSLMINKMRKFSAASQTVMKVASCLGASFSTKALEAILADDDEHSIDSSSVGNTVGLFEDEGLWERDEADLDTYRFVHDQIQSAAFELIPPEQRDDLRGEIGLTLMHKLAGDEVAFDRHLFEIVSLRNHASSSLTAEERLDLADLNLRAGIKASENAAFDTSVVYLEIARELWGPHAWDDDSIDSDKIVELHIKEAQARFVLGHLDTMKMLVDELLSKDLPIQQVFEAYETKILALHAANDFDESMSLALEVRRKLGFQAIQTKPSILTILLEFWKTNKVVAGRSAEELAALPALTDERIMIGRRMLELLFASTYQANPSVYPLISFRLVRSTVKYGVNRSSCDGFATYGHLLCGVFGDPKRGREMGRAAELIAQKPEAKTRKSRALCMVNAGINFHYNSPLRAALRPLLEGYQAGLQVGDTEGAGFNRELFTFAQAIAHVESQIATVFSRSCLLWHSGSKLKDILPELRTCVTVLKQMHQIGNMMCVMPYYQAAKNLSGEEEELPSDRPWILKGSEYDFDEALDVAINTTKNKMLAAYIVVVQLDLLVLYQQWPDAEKLLTKSQDPTKKGILVRFTFLEGLISLKAAQASGSWMQKRRWAARAKKARKTLKARVTKGNSNAVHTLQLLTAELNLFHGKVKEAEEGFKQAQIGAKRTGFMQDLALSHELAGLHYLKRGDDYWAKHNLQCAYEAYFDWQAYVKADRLRLQYPEYISAA